MKKLNIIIFFSIVSIHCLSQCAINYVGSWRVRACGDTARNCTATIKEITPNKIVISNFFCIPYYVINCDDTIIADINCNTDSLVLEPVNYIAHANAGLFFRGTGSLTSDSIEIHYIYTTPNGTSDVCVAYDKHTVGINELAIPDNTLNVYPNPSNGSFTLALSNITEKCNVEIYNVLGEQIYNAAAPTQPPPGGGGPSEPVIRAGVSVSYAPAFSYNINLSSQPSGVYFYRVTNENGGLIWEREGYCRALESFLRGISSKITEPGWSDIHS